MSCPPPARAPVDWFEHLFPGGLQLSDVIAPVAVYITDILHDLRERLDDARVLEWKAPPRTSFDATHSLFDFVKALQQDAELVEALGVALARHRGLKYLLDGSGTALALCAVPVNSLSNRTKQVLAAPTCHRRRTPT
jgi:hypothetical protein